MKKNKVEIIAHRGLWKNLIQQNSLTSLKEALNNGYGIEFDIRNDNKNIIVQHDAFNAKKKNFNIDDLFIYYKNKNLNNYLLINIKSDGILSRLKYKIKKFNIRRYFIFDMSIPETIIAKKLKINFLQRFSEYETPSRILKSNGLWVDIFRNYNKLNKLNKNNFKKHCVFVSPELHKKKNILKFWKKIKKFSYSSSKIMICTDFPFKADEYLND